MTNKPVYRMTDPDSGDSRRVYVIREYYANAGAQNCQIAVADVEDVVTGERIDEVPRERLKPE